MQVSSEKATFGQSKQLCMGYYQRKNYVKNQRSPLVCQAKAKATEPKNILMMGGTRFIGVYLSRLLIEEGHNVTLFTRGKSKVTFKIPDDTDSDFQKFTNSVCHIAGDRKDYEDLKSKISKGNFNIVYDINGREAEEVAPIIEALPNLEQYIYCSSAGVYKKSHEMPHREEDEIDPKSRHKGKLETETLLSKSGITWTSIRPVYIYGPLNYNPVEEWFFQRIQARRPIPVPNSGLQITQLGHVKDLADAFVACLGNEKAKNQIYNISGEKFVTFDGIARACAEAMGQPAPELIHFDPKEFNFGKKKSFPMRDQHFYASIDKAMIDLNWKPKFGLIDGLKDSYQKDFGQGTYRKAPDFTTDDMIIERQKILV